MEGEISLKMNKPQTMRDRIWNCIKTWVNDDNKTGLTLIKAGLIILGILRSNGKYTTHPIYPLMVLAQISISGCMMVLNIRSIGESESEEELIVFIKILVPLFALVFAAIKLVVMHAFIERLRSVLAYADSLGRREKGNYYKISEFNSVSKSYAIGIMLTMTGSVVAGTVETGLPLPVFWPLQKTGMIYYAAFSFFIVTTLLVGLSHASVDICLSQLTGHVVYQARKMRDCLNKLGRRKEVDQRTWERAWRTHVCILKLVGQIRRCYGLVLLFQGAYTIAHSSIVIFAIVKVSYLPFILGNAMPMIITAYAQLLVYCYAGEAIKTEMAMVNLKVCDNHWYESDLKMRKLVFVMVLVSGRPVELHSYRMFTANFQVYLMNVRESFSYFLAFRKLTS